ncbi:RecB family exonuclease [Vreelandella jeotgali]|uniref:RecB family exonuclease n=1 Tax=Vreelandella jeotgali TaxID=553386 RepID=UPI00034D05B7|nr:PD-(D/E)XK nuclease family protein [Halomonas jeotgali]
MTDQTFDPKNFKKPTTLNPEETKPADAGDTFNPAAIKGRMKAAAEAEEQRTTDLLTAPLGPVPTWSFSRLMQFESCPYSIYLKNVEKMPDPSGPAAERGTMIHEHIENFIQGEHDDLKGLRLPAGMKSVNLAPFEKIIGGLRSAYEEGRVGVEGNWGFTRDWTTTDFFGKDVWTRMKLDAIEFDSDTSARVHDWKSGRKFNNELKHNQQGMTYAIGAFMRYPELEFIETWFEYVDQNDRMSNTYTRERAMLLKPMIDRRANEMTTATKFPPKPSMHACKFCPHARVQEGFDEPACPYAYQET